MLSTQKFIENKNHFLDDPIDLTLSRSILKRVKPVLFKKYLENEIGNAVISILQKMNPDDEAVCEIQYDQKIELDILKQINFDVLGKEKYKIKIFTREKGDNEKNNEKNNENEKKKVIGQGQYSLVEEFGKDKVVKWSRSKEFYITKDFLVEVGILKTLSHKNIIKIEGVVLEKERIGIIFEKLSHTLLYAIENNFIEDISHIEKQLRDAIKYMNYKRITHNDIHDENIMFDSKNVPKLIDFGSASFNSPDSWEDERNLGDYLILN